jgi:hypothetical protein
MLADEFEMKDFGVESLRIKSLRWRFILIEMSEICTCHMKKVR